MTQFHNNTRMSQSIPRKLLRERRPYLIPVYYLMRTSMLASEGIENSGSYRFADYIYEGIPRGRNIIGRLLDGVFLRMKSAIAMRSRYTFGKQELEQAILRAYEERKMIDVLSVPCGLARELFEIADDLQNRAPDVLRFVRFHGIDLDRRLIEELQSKANGYHAQMRFTVGDALDEKTYLQKYDAILSMGFNEFLTDRLVIRFFQIAKRQLAHNGVFITCGLGSNRLSEYLLRNLAELLATYRSSEQLRRLAECAGLKVLSLYHDDSGLQTMLITQPEKNDHSRTNSRPEDQETLSMEYA